VIIVTGNVRVRAECLDAALAISVQHVERLITHLTAGPDGGRVER
jgi:hypothetical protein